MRYKNIPAALFTENRTLFSVKMKKNSIAIFASNDVMPTNADDAMGFAQNSDLFYLSGIDQEETILLLYPDALKEEYRCILFIKETSAYSKLWDGEVLTSQAAMHISGIKTVKFIGEFERTLQLFAFEADVFYLGHNEHIKRLTSEMLTRQDRLIRWCREKYPLHQYERAAKLTRELRMIKSDAEIDLLKEAISISKKCFDNVFKAITPTAYEYEIEAQLTHELIRNGATRHAFKPIIASGKNACIMHYNSNDSICREGSMVLIDFGVCYANYNSDITRCIPVNGIFSTRQRAVYESVLQCLKNGATLLKPGKSFREYEKQMAALIEEELIKLNLITPKEIETQLPDQPAYKKYFMHGTAHHLGLDVHDVGHYSGFIEKGMVLTCEPGIYIPEENLGCRLENNYLITENGNINLTAAIPIEVDDIETLCKRSKNKMHSA